MKAQLIKANGQIQFVEPKNGTDFQLEELNGFVEGYIEIIRPPMKPDCIMVINEEGKLKGLPYNATASLIWLHDDIVGNALLCHRSQVR